MIYYAGTNLLICISGVNLSLRGIPVDSIGSDENGALICYTDSIDCCTSTLSPNGVELGH